MRADEGEDPISEMCRVVLGGIDAIAEEAVRRIRTRLPAYEVVPLTEHLESTRTQLVVTLEFVDAQRVDISPTGAELEAARELGRRRALQGLSLADVIESFHLGSRELYRALVENAPPAATPDAVRAGGMLWELVHAGTTAVAAGHDEATRTDQAVRANRRSRLLEMLERADFTEETAEIAIALGFDPAGDFQVICTSSGNWSDVELQQLQHDQEGGPATALSSRRGDVVVTLFQNISSSHVLESIQRVIGRGAAGSGLLRGGLAGAAMSVDDARRALAVSQKRDMPAAFEDVWLHALVLEHRDEMADLLERGAEVAAEHPHLAEAVAAFAANGFSVSAAARALHLHTNSLAYRLERWKALTDWDLRTTDGLVRSLASLELS